ncbi:MAG: 16S rRNA (cytosine(1402)-N(4))-methyltransferase RsmH [Desulfomonilia bacterium]|jgi:16S rRNA (cytosine1402-N4)-methyltransferase|uniref:S-adenosyl-dependent methyltransferase activity on membrane-located substrates n=1 Tax=anaerobic digester metagenome TaxID=1263854 RepID=A0A485M357_9ZZZZ|nr:16S rRNA (cytosine(1402)-N(4))-methyltransferase RsmH [Pseudomonadota bacterium]HON38084.1 16S rRNA (cytosine(1402)-N(4))-methyltransferase RsmH [Deltaproteobacteria bacterium]HPD21694.1 16S rRNA (cytosine(1402)-N(4))-methyltransferase RsmH [Deltaproteobacteria bacterium]HRS56270.1 16S rRNA (cytosine(1402)-N(4))-methyltransferase RsmH [Desulfomonilia bacterium]HRV36282.1 16S rRNA (cytosine(1402)-N(4))-methyltransferase RsmH [Desulfomonilia bacterium]
MQHVPVLLSEVLEVMMPHSGGRYFDGTLGYGGHARAILEKSAPGGLLAGVDLDGAAVLRLQQSLADYTGRVFIFQGNFTEIDRICAMLGWENLDGVLLDLGMSSTALDDPDRGFSFLRQGPLDMRFSTENTLSADTVVNTYDEHRLASLIHTYGEERFAPRIARRIVESRPVKSTTELAEIVSSAIPRRFWPKKIHPATKTFQAIRMEVNQEIENLQSFLPKAASLLAPGGVIAIISFHSLEDRIVKRFFAGTPERFVYPRGLPAPAPEEPRLLKPITRKSITPSEEEVRNNPRSRSARLRAARRLS